MMANVPSSTTPPQQPEPGQLAELSRTHSYTLGRPFHVRVSGDGQRVLFLRASATDPVADLFVREASGVRRLLSAREILGGKTEELSAAEKAERERRRIKTAGFTGFQISADGDRLVLKLDGQLYLHDFSDARTVKVVLPDGVILNPKLSPSARSLAFVLDDDLHTVDLPESLPKAESLRPTPRRLTDDGELTPNGVAEFVAQEEMSRYDGYWWSPDSSRLLFQQNDERALERFTIADAAHPERPAVEFPYPRPGKPNVDVRLFLVPVGGGERTELAWDRETFPYLAKVVWPSKGPLCLLVQARDQRSQAFLRVDGATGRARPLFEERDEAWLNIHDSTPSFLADGLSFLWATEEGGAWRLERKHLSEDLSAVVRREVVVEEKAGFHTLAHVDEGKGWVWFLGGPDPAQMHLYRARLDGKGDPEQATSGVGWNEAAFSSGGRVAAVTRASLLDLPETFVHSVGAHGQLDAGTALPHEAESPKRTPEVELVAPERAGGFRSAVLRPAKFDPKKTYPVVLYVYGGPGHSVVRAQMSAWFVQQWIADHGFIVVSLDGRGTPRRGRDFERALRGRFHDVPLDDQVAGLLALAKHVPQMDLNRVGVYGWSFGGYMSALSVLRRPDVFKAGVAGAPVVDWLYYDTHYTERYLGVPSDGESGAYTLGNLLTYADELERPLMLVHGVADDNVYFAHTLQLADALFMRGKPFELVPLVGLTHQVSDPRVREALFARIVRFLGAQLW